MERIVLVDEEDRPLGVAEKLAAHRAGGRLHRAFSIFVFGARGETLLQRRAQRKYHFRGLWANACCGHPRPGEDVAAAAHRRLREELGFETPLRRVFSFLYAAADPGSDFCERELDHVFVGHWEGEPDPDPDEVDAVRWIGVPELEADLARHPGRYAPWLPPAVEGLRRRGLLP